jgi:3-hydroxyacyl-CoA dehydrogenase/3-hydroxy-2-methylbutyryl-CoA dehydrogenase
MPSAPPLVVNVASGGVGGGRTVGRDGTPHSKDDFVETMAMNAFGTFNVSRLAAAAMAANEPNEDGERGVIVNTSSKSRNLEISKSRR